MSAKKHHSLWIFGGAFLALVAVAVIWMIQDSRKAENADDPAQAESKARPRHDTTRDVDRTHSSSTSESSSTEPAGKQDDAPPSDAGMAKLSPRQGATTRDGNKSVIDPTASWQETPPWPEGPKLYAEVETGNRRYINLRPNDIGLLPKLSVRAQEVLDISLQLPDATPGESIHVELPNGGRFPDEKMNGRMLTVAENQTVTFQVEADDEAGNCTIHIRQAGHTRTIPLWIGDPPKLVVSDDEP